MPLVGLVIAIYIGYNLLKEALEPRVPPMSEEEFNKRFEPKLTEKQIEAAKIQERIFEEAIQESLSYRNKK